MHSVQTLQREHSNRRRSNYLPYQPVSGIRATGNDVNCEQLSVEHYINIYYNIINNTLQAESAVLQRLQQVWLQLLSGILTSESFCFVFCCRRNDGYRKLGVFGFVLFFIIVIHLGILFIVQVFWQISLTSFFLLINKPYFCLF